MISWLIIHHNRPYFLGLYIELLRRFGASDWQIVVTDCGSDTEVQKKIKKLDMDELHLGENNYPKAIMDGKKLCKKDFFVFSEEDLPYVAQPLRNRDVHCERVQHCIFPNINFNQSKPEWGYKEAIEMLRIHPSVKYLKMGFRKIAWKDQWKIIRNKIMFPCKSQKTPITPWFRLNVEINNWPYLMRMEDAIKMDYPDSLIKKSYHAGACNVIEWYDRDRFGFPDRTSISAGIATPVHTHMGSWLSVNDPEYHSFGGSQDRRGNHIAEKFNLQLPGSNPLQRGQNLNAKLLKLWLNGKFYIDFKEILELGLAGGMNCAFSRIKGM